jgi:septum formation protein
VRRLVLASASPARRLLLESAGLRPEVVVSHVAEHGVDDLAPVDAVAALARRKGQAVVARLGADPGFDIDRDRPLVVAGDSLLEFDGEAWGKPAEAGEVIARWLRLRGGTGLLHTGHFVCDVVAGEEAEETDTAVVRFGTPSDREVRAYASHPESLQVAGPFTLEGRSAPWIDSIDGNYGTITGISLPVLRRLLSRLGVEILDLWT